MTQTILVLSPHTDDVEIAMGATIAKLVRLGHDVHVYDFCSKSKEFPEDTLEKEHLKAMKILCLDGNNIGGYNFPIREFGIHRQKILDVILRLKRIVKPNVVFIPSKRDVHQDHQVIYWESSNSKVMLTSRNGDSGI